MKEIAQLLIDIKVQRKALARTKQLGGPAYDTFSDTICKLYKTLDSASIEDLEKLHRLARR
jgi:hypothetical protein